MAEHFDETVLFQIDKAENSAANVLATVFQALRERGYDPVNQLVGYILSGDPTYITSHKNARVLIRSIEREELIEELVKSYDRATRPK